MLGRRQHTLQEEKQPRRGYLHCPQVLLAKGVERAAVPCTFSAGVFVPVQPKDLLLLLRESVCLSELGKEQREQRQGAEPTIAFAGGPSAQRLDSQSSFSPLKISVIKAQQIF